MPSIAGQRLQLIYISDNDGMEKRESLNPAADGDIDNDIAASRHCS